MAEEPNKDAGSTMTAKLKSGGDQLAGWALLAPGEVAQAASRMRPATMTWIGIVLAGLILLSVNIISASVFKNATTDLTASGLYTISDGTKRVLSNIKEPVSVKIYFSDRLGEISALHKRLFGRVRGLFERYQSLTGGMLNVQFIDPKPFSDAEDRAVAAGLTGVRLGGEGEKGYFGLVATNSTDNREIVPFFAPQRETFLEYDMTKLVHKLASPKKPVIGIISGVSLNGGMTPRRQRLKPWLVMNQIKEFFEVEMLTQGVKEIPAKVDVLMLVNPLAMSADVGYAIDQFALRGGRILAFLDPVSEITVGYNPTMAGAGTSNPDMDKLLKAWGVKFDAKNVVGDVGNARRVQAGGANGLVTDYVAWHEVKGRSIVTGEVVTDGVKIMNIATPGHFEALKGSATKLEPIISSTKAATLISAMKFMGRPDPAGLLRDYKPGGKSYILAGRLAGPIKTAYPEGRPKTKDDKKEPKKAAEAKTDKAKQQQIKSGKINAILIGDSDMLYDDFWVTVRDMLGQQVLMPIAHNVAFVMNALENLSGGEALSGLRGRGVEDRPFELVNEIRKRSEQKFRKTEQGLIAKLQGLQARLEKVAQKTGKDGRVSLALSEQDKQAVEAARADMIKTRQQLRSVKHSLRADIESLEGWVKFINIALVPLLIAIGAFAFAAYRRRRAAHA
jgi:gliding motility-associatede transport system auxiliary component